MLVLTIILCRDVEISLKFSTRSKSAQVVHHTRDKYCNPLKITVTNLPSVTQTCPSEIFHLQEKNIVIATYNEILANFKESKTHRARY